MCIKHSLPMTLSILIVSFIGAALATLTAIDLITAKISPVRLFNYGSPRIGNQVQSTVLYCILTGY